VIAIFLFFNKGLGKFVNFIRDKDFLHAAVICYQGDVPVLMEASESGISYRVVKTSDMTNLMEKIILMPSLTNYVAVKINKGIFITEFPFKYFTCNEVCRFVSGVDIGLTLSPKHLFQKLVDFKNHKNYFLMNVWSRNGRR
jgi:hypothetical protein